MIVCINCGGRKTELVRNIIANGASQVFYVCLACGKNAKGSGIYIKQGNGMNLDELRILNDYRLNMPPCAHCGSKLGVELHHWSPRHIFDDPDNWPVDYLCKVCHDKWHKTIAAHNSSTCKYCKGLSKKVVYVHQQTT